MRFDFFMEHFDSAEAEAMTGVSQMLQRSYRKRGYLPPQPDHSHYGLFDLTELQFIRAMAARGLEILLANDLRGGWRKASPSTRCANAPGGPWSV